MQTAEKPTTATAKLDRDEKCRRETVRVGTKVATHAALFHTPLGAVLMPILVWLMKPALLSSSALLKSGNDFSWAMMPLVIFFFAGSIYGGFLGWRIVESSGMTGLLSWAIGSAAVGVITLVAAISALMLFPQPAPTMVWVSLSMLAAGGLLGITAFAHWLA